MRNFLLALIFGTGSVAYLSAWNDLDRLLHPQVAHADIQLRYHGRVAGAPFPDTDADGRIDAFDNCPMVYNPNQTDVDRDGVGDAFDREPGCDTTCAMTYPQHDYCHVRTVKTVAWYDKGEEFSFYQSCNAATPANPDDFCDTEHLTPEKYDDDGDGVPNVRDLCPQTIDPDQDDTDRDGIGDACDTQDPCGARKLPCAPSEEDSATKNGLALQTVTD